jgi:protein phosphatase
MEVGASTDAGKEQSFNGDSHHAAVVPESPDNPWKIDALLAVADSRSAVIGGAPVSQLAMQALVRSFVSVEAGSAGYRRTGDRDLELFLQVVTEYVNDVVYHAGNNLEGTHVGTTLTFVVVRGSRYYVSHVGNSRAYLIRDGHIHQLTRDHSWIAEQVRLREMTESEAKLSPFRDRLMQAIGMRSAVEPEMIVDTLREGDTLLLCSDGLTKRLSQDDLRRALALSSSLQRACDSLMQMAKERDADEAITVVAVRTGTPMKPLTDMVEEARQASASDISPAERFLNSLSRLIAQAQSKSALAIFVIVILLGALAMGMLNGSILPRRQNNPQPKPNVYSQRQTPDQKTHLSQPVELVVLKVVADEQKQGVRLHAASGQVVLESKGEQQQGEQQGDDVFVAFQSWQGTRDRLIEGSGQLIVKQTKGKVSIRALGNPQKYERFFRGDPLNIKVSPEGSYLLLFQSSSGRVIRLCRFGVKW